MFELLERGGLPGFVALLGRGDDVHVDAVGTTAVGGTEPMRRDTIFRITSMTKPIAAVATLSLVEEGLLDLDEPLDRLVPELADRRVLRRLDGPVTDTEPALRSLTTRDLLTLRMGFGFLVGDAQRHPILAAAEEHGVYMGPPRPADTVHPDEWLRRFARLPLMDQPGQRWRYDLAFSVLGVVIARAAGQPLPAVLLDRVLEPLGMRDTGFSVPPTDLHRLPPAYTAAGEVFDGAPDSQWAAPPAFPDAAGGLVSTVDDVLSFARTLLAGGGPVLSAESVTAMTTNWLTSEQRAASDAVPVFLGDAGWGLGIGVEPDRYGWAGGLGTIWYAYPADGLVAILLTQCVPPPGELFDQFLRTVEAHRG
ncbi:MAG TPA: serine hydrolase domain-containing protein [Pseudonocardiaceae bacterium]|nr:serine hydrolase domain-containing protein [Pseudonocardiaceae bacterium]